MNNFFERQERFYKHKNEHNEKLICDNKEISITDSVILRIYSKKITSDLIKKK